MEIDLGDVQLRPFDPDDAAGLAAIADNPKIAANLRDNFPSPYSEDQAREFIAMATGDGPDVYTAIASGPTVIGSIGLHAQADVLRRSAELGFFVAESHWGRGIATRAIGAVLERAFHNLPLNRIFAQVFEWNPTSRRVLEKLGFTLEGRLRQAVVKNDEVMDLFVYGLLRDDPKGPHHTCGRQPLA